MIRGYDATVDVVALTERPTFASRAGDQSGGFGTIGDPAVRRIPVDFSAQLDREITQVREFGKTGGVGKVR